MLKRGWAKEEITSLVEPILNEKKIEGNMQNGVSGRCKRINKFGRTDRDFGWQACNGEKVKQWTREAS